MRAVIQRVSRASVTVEGDVIADIDQGYLILLGVESEDIQEDIDWLCKKVIGLRIFEDEDHKMNKSILDIAGDIIVVSQFTLHASTKKGNRPSFIKAARPEQAIPLYEAFVKQLSVLLGKKVKTGKFGAMMQVDLCNSGPVTIIIDTKNKE